MKNILFILVLFFSHLSWGQYSYSYVDPCSGRTKSIFIPAGQNNITVNYYGNVNVFNSNDFNNGNFYAWVTSVSQANSSSPCSEIITTLTNNINMIVTQNVITVTTNVLSIADLAFSVAEINSLSGSITGLAEAISNSEDSEEEKKNKQNGQSTTNNGVPNGGSILSNNSSGSNLPVSTNLQTTQEKINSPNGTTNGNSSGNSKTANDIGITAGSSNSTGAQISNEKSQPSNGESNNTQNTGSFNGQSNETSKASISQKETSTSGGSESGLTSTNVSQTANTSATSNSAASKNIVNQSDNQPVNSGNMDSSTVLNGKSNNNSNTVSQSDQQGSQSISSISNTNVTTNNPTNTGSTNIAQNNSTTSNTTTNTSVNNQSSTNITAQSPNSGNVNTNFINNSTNKNTSNPGGFGQTSIAISNAEENSGDSEKKTGSMIGTGDLVVMKSAEDPTASNQYRFNSSLTHANTNNTRIKGVLANYTTGINNTNVTFYKAWVFKKSKLTAIAANSSMMNFEKDFFNTSTFVLSKRYRGNWKKLTTMLGLNLTAGNYGETRFANASLMGGGFYSYKITKKLSGSTLMIAVYSPFTQFFDGRWWDSSTLLVPYSTWDYSITKTFKLNVSFSGVYEMNKNMLNYQVMTGGKIIF